MIIAQSREVRRSIDYLETRPEIDKSRLGYLGVSAGLKAIAFLDGGFFLGPVARGRDQMDFAPP